MRLSDAIEALTHEQILELEQKHKELSPEDAVLYTRRITKAFKRTEFMLEFPAIYASFIWIYLEEQRIYNAIKATKKNLQRK